MFDVRGILGLGSYYLCFIRNLSETVQPLMALTKRDKPFKWTEQCQKAFDDIKQALISPTIMAFSTDDGKFILDTDASDETVRAVLSQIQSWSREGDLPMVAEPLGSLREIIVQLIESCWQ